MKCPNCDYETAKKSNLTRHINAKHAVTATWFPCTVCDRKYKYQNNLIRHMVIHPYTSQNNTISSQNNTISSQNNTIVAQKDTISSQKDTIAKPTNICDKCSKVFASKYSLQRHTNICDGTKDTKTCPKCMKVFAFVQGKNRHLKTCEGSKELVLVPQQQQQQSGQVPSSVINNNHIQTQNNNNNIQQNNNIVINYTNIVAFNPENITETVQMLTDDIDIKKIKNAIKTQAKPDVLLSYTKQLLNKSENRCVKKTNLRSGHSSVHVGNNKWEVKPDVIVYPKLVSDIATMFSDFLSGQRNKLSVPKHILEALMQFTEYIADNGYCNETTVEQERVKSNYKRIIAGTKTAVYKNSNSVLPTIATE